MSLVEISVALGLLGVGGYFLTQMISHTSRGTSRVTAKLDFDSSSSMIQMLLRRSDNCTAYFGNQVFFSDPATLSTQVIGNSSTLAIHMPNDPMKIVAKPGSPLARNIETTALTISKLVLQAPDKYLATLHLEAAQSNVTKAPPLSREFPLELSTIDVPSTSPAQKRIVSCAGPAGAGGGGAMGFQIAQALRTDGAQDTGVDVSSNRKITMLVGPRSAVVALNDVPNHPDSDYAYAGNLDGMKCNDAEGWYLTGCWNAGTEGDHFPYANGCITNDFDQHSKNDLSINCIKSASTP